MRSSKLQTVIRREFFERVRSKWFLVATVLGPVLMGLLLFLPTIMADRERRAENGVVRILDYSADSVGVVIASRLRGGVQGDSTRAQYRRVLTTEMFERERTEATNALSRGELIGFLEIDSTLLSRGRLRYVGRNTTSLVTMQQLERTVNRAVLLRQLEAAGLDADRSEQLAAQQLRLDTERFSRRGKGASGTIGVMFALSIAVTLYLTIFIHGSNVMRGVLEEKQSRVAEVVLSSVRSDTLLIGKIAGIGTVGVTQLAAWVAIATAMLYIRGPVLARFGIVSADFALPEISASMAVLILLIFIIGFLFYAALFAIVGAMVSTEQDAQQAQMPVVLLLALTLSSVQAILTNPDGVSARLLSILPFSSPIVLPLRLSLTPLERTELILSISVLALSAAGATFIASRIYRVGILMYGKRPTIREAMRWIRSR